MHYVGVDLHKKSITVAVATREGIKPKIEMIKRFDCDSPWIIEDFFQALGAFEVVVEATASYEWLLKMLEPMANRCVLAHPGHLRIIAQSTCKTDRIDAKILAEFLALDRIPEAHRPTPRVRQLRVQSRLRYWIKKKSTSLKNKIHHKLSHYNLDIEKLFNREGRFYLANVRLDPIDRFEVDLLCEQLDLCEQQIKRVEKQIQEFAKSAAAAEKEARAVLQSAPLIGPVTTEVILGELGDVRRFSNHRQVSKYAGLDPGIRSSGKKVKQLSIVKAGSGFLRWALIETAWRWVGKLSHWRAIYDQLCQNTGSKKKAIVAVARRILGVLYSMLKNGKHYQPQGEPNPGKARASKPRMVGVRSPA